MSDPPPAHRPRRIVPLWATVLLAGAAVLAAYGSSALSARFLNFDDNLFFGPEGALQEGIGRVLDPSRPIANAYLPVSHLSLWLDFWWLGADPTAAHLVALLWHAAAGAALARTLLALGAGPVAAHAAALWFLLHPALAESVAWVSGRKDILSGLFVFLALGATVRHARAPRLRTLLLLMLLGALACYSKATAVVLPLLALGVCLFERKAGPRKFLAPLSLLVVSLPILAHHASIAASEGTTGSPRPGAPSDRILQAAGALAHYLGAACWPSGLNVLYPEESTLERFASRGTAGLLVLALAAGLSLAAFRSRRFKLAGLGGLWALIAVLPFNTVLPSSSIAAADRYLYLVVPGVALALASIAAAIPRVGPWLAVALAVLLGWLSHARAGDFRDSETLWRRSLEQDPDNAVAWLNLAAEIQRLHPGEIDLLREPVEKALASARHPIHELRARRALAEIAVLTDHAQEGAIHARGAVDAAERLFALEQSPVRKEQARRRLLDTLLASFEPLRRGGEEDAARAALSRAESLSPKDPAVVAGKALLLVDEIERAGEAGAADPRIADAESEIRSILEGRPDEPDLCHAMGRLLVLQDRKLEALKYFRRALRRDPSHVEACLSAARLCRLNGLAEEAERYARQGLAARPDPRLRHELSLALVAQLRMDDAIDNLKIYLNARPRDRDAARILSSLLCGKAIAGMGDKTPNELERLLEEALLYNPHEPRVDIVRGKICRDRRQFDRAIEHLTRAHAAFPDLEDVTSMLAQCWRDRGYQSLLETDPPDLDGAIAAWREFLRLAPSDVDTEPVRMQMTSIWNRSEAAGVELLKAGRKAEAAVEFRRCLAANPNQHWASWLLAQAIYGEAGADLAELDELTSQALSWQLEHGLDRSRQALLRVLVLRDLGRMPEAVDLARSLVSKPDPGADPEVLAELRRIAGV